MRSPFASRNQSQPIAFLCDPSQSFIVRKLTGREDERAQGAYAKAMASGESRGIGAALEGILRGSGTPADVDKALADPLRGYDRTSLVRAGLVSWTYDEPIVPGVIDGVLVDPITDLDDETLTQIATEVMRLSIPSRFQTDEEAEAARKNG